jgi:signal transduction histidine kinase/CheY-like chemotaxis protein
MFERLLWLRERRWMGYAAAVVLCVAGLVVRLALDSIFPGVPFLAFGPAIIIATLIGGIRPGIAATILTGLLVNHFILIPARYSIFWPNSWFLLLSFTLITGTIVCLVDISVRTSIRLASAGAALKAANEGLERRIAERTDALMQAEEQLRQAHKMEAVGQLTGGIAHDFNNLLTSINGSLEMLQTRLKQGRVEELDRYVTAARESSSRASSLTHRLLAFARQQTLAPRAIEVTGLIAGMEDLIRRSIGPGITLRVVAQGRPAIVQVDPNQLEHALLNLCINASDAMPAGGDLRISVASPAAGLVGISVHDTGLGMTPEVMERVFEPFFTTKPLGQGTGLGLSMIYGFAHQSGGEVQLDSRPGAGTNVTILLPRFEGDITEVPDTPPPATPVPAQTSKTVLVVDDEPSLRMLVTEVLDDLGYALLEAGDGQTAMQHIKAGGAIDLLVTDIGLPGGMDGKQLADAARLLHPALKILFITGYAEGRHGPLPAGTTLLTKPFSLETLATRVQDLLAV